MKIKIAVALVVLQLSIRRSMGAQELSEERVDTTSSGGQFEELVVELNLTPNIS